ncbi:MAG TPA: GTP 3',8-cyclase MoaA, partial [Acinetobacter sp.]|nr:GTP 3',8-cyclase MoaA [Acinetobacter sp.]
MTHEIPTTTLPILQDQYGRMKRKLRISVTDRCNFKCVY